MMSERVIFVMGYLVISLKLGQRCKIGNDIEIRFSDYHEGRVDVAIKAPKEQRIERLKTLSEEEFGHANKNRSRHRTRESFSK